MAEHQVCAHPRFDDIVVVDLSEGDKRSCHLLGAGDRYGLCKTLEAMLVAY